MNNCVLTVGISYEFFEYLNSQFSACDIETVYAVTISEGVRQFTHRIFHLIIVDLQGVQKETRAKLLVALRQAKFVPIFVLTDSESPEDIARKLDFGVDLCLPSSTPPLLIFKHAVSLIRRYTAYNHYDQPEAVEAAPFECGDIYIDPLRHTVQVRGQPIALKPREFALLLYFMRNPNIVLDTERICENAWGKEGGYGKGVSSPIARLRSAIEPDPEHPIYIETIHRVGYRFTAYKHETCDI